MRLATSFFAVVWFMLASLLAVSVVSAQSKTKKSDNPLPGVDLPMPTPIILPSPTGQHVVCVQWVPEGFKWRDKFDGKSVVRVAVVDSKKRSVVAKRDLPSGKLRFAAGRDEVYVADNDAKTVEALSFRDLSSLRSAKLEKAVDDLQLVADKLLCSTDGRVRLDLETLLPSKEWAPLAAYSQGAEFNVISPQDGGWFVDGVIYDETLSEPRCIIMSPLAPLDQSRDGVSRHFTPWTKNLERFDVSGAVPDTWREVSKSATIADEVPAYLFAAAPAAPAPGADIPMVLQLISRLEKKIVAETRAGTISRKYADGEGGKWKLKWDSDSPAKYSPVLSRFAPGSVPVSLNSVGGRVLVAQANAQAVGRSMAAALPGIGIFLGLVATGLTVFGVMATVSEPTPGETQMITRGPVLALAGIVPFVLALAIGFLLPKMSPGADLVIGGLIVPAVVTFFGLQLCSSAFFTATDKGHDVGTGIALAVALPVVCGILLFWLARLNVLPVWLTLGIMPAVCAPGGLIVGLLLPNCQPRISQPNVEPRPQPRPANRAKQIGQGAEPMLLKPAARPAIESDDLDESDESEETESLDGAKPLGLGFAAVAVLGVALLIWFTAAKLNSPGLSIGFALLMGQLIVSVVVAIKCLARPPVSGDVRGFAWLAFVLALLVSVYMVLFFSSGRPLLGIWFLAQIPLVVLLVKSYSQPNSE